MAKGENDKGRRNLGKQRKPRKNLGKPIIPLTPAERTMHLKERKYPPDLTSTKRSMTSDGRGDYVRRAKTTYPGMTVGSSDADGGGNIYTSLISRVASAERPKIGVTGRIRISFKEGYKVGEDDTLVPPGMIRLNSETTIVEGRHMGAEYDFAYRGSFDDLANYFRKRTHIKWSISNPAIYVV